MIKRSIIIAACLIGTSSTAEPVYSCSVLDVALVGDQGLFASSGYTELVENGQHDVVFGARDVAGASVAVKRRLLRTIASSVFRGIVRRLISRTITDTQCGLKIFSRAAANQVFSRTTIDGFAFDAEVVFLARRLRLSLSCVPVRLINEDGSTLSLTRHALPMLMDVLKIRWQEFVGNYQWEAPEVVPSKPAVAPQRAA